MFSAKPKAPRPTGKAGRYESSQRNCGPSDNSPKRAFRQTEGQYRTNELVRRRMNFSSDAMADFEGLLEVNRKICKQQMAEKASPTLPTNCAVLP